MATDAVRNATASATDSLWREQARRLRYEELAKALLAAPDPVHAIAHHLGDQEGRIDALAAALAKVEQRCDWIASDLRKSNESRARGLESAS